MALHLLWRVVRTGLFLVDSLTASAIIGGTVCATSANHLTPEGCRIAVAVSRAWKIRVVVKNAGWDQRFVIAGSVASDGAHAGTIGAQVQADGANWSIQVQGRGDRAWLNSDMRIGPESRPASR
jgi:hypothetical protein